MISNSLILRRFSLFLVVVGILISTSESKAASGALCTGLLRKQIESATSSIAGLVKRIELSEAREERMGLFFEVAPHIENYFKQMESLKSLESNKAAPTEIPGAESAIYDLVWDIYEKGDKNAGAVKVLKLLSGIHSPSIVTNTKVYATAALLNARQGDEEVAQELWVLVNGLKPNPGLDRLFGADNFSDQEIDIKQNLIAAGEQALLLAARNGNPQALRLLNTRVEFSSSKPLGTNRL
jgi:hypothetical protein